MKLPSIVRAKKGNIVGGILTTAVFLAIAMLIFATVIANVSTASMTATQNTTYQGVITHAWTGFGLMGVMLIVMAAFAILSIVGGRAE